MVMGGQDLLGRLSGTKAADAHLGAVLVLGLGVSGRACIEYLTGPARDRWETLTVYGGARTDEACAAAERVEQAGGRVIFDEETVAGVFDLAIVSPGIPETSEFYRSAKAAATELIGELEFAWRESAARSRWVAITGTNGKTTTTTLTAALLSAGGLNALAVGNIGDAAITAVQDRSVDVFVAEVSSFQLASTLRFAPDVAILLNITPDHLAWHGGFEAYANAKLKILDHLADNAGAVAVLNATDDRTREVIKAIRADEQRGYEYIPIGTARGVGNDMRKACGSANAAFVAENGDFTIALGGRVTTVDLSAGFGLVGDHNRVNGLAAAAAATALGVDAAAIARALGAARPLEHRIEYCGEVDGVSFYDDSKATNVDATLVALTAFGTTRPIVLLGGKDKGTDLTPLVAACRASAKAVVCFGEAGGRFLEAFGGTSRGDDALTIASAATMRDAFTCACDLAGQGDVVVLSPACSSFDEFRCFEERGDAFKAFVANRAGRR